MSVIRFKPSVTEPFEGATLNRLDELTGNFLLALFNGSPDNIMLVNLDGSISYMNHNAVQAFEVESFDELEGKSWISLWPHNERERILSVISDASKGTATSFEAYCPTLRDSQRWWSVNVAPVVAKDGKTAIMLIKTRDVTEQLLTRKKLEKLSSQLKAENARKDALLEQKQLLAAEIDHRVKNSFSLISGVLRLQERAMEDSAAKAAISEAANRIMSVAEVHEHLSLSPDVSTVAVAPFLSSLMSKIGEAHYGLANLEEGHIADFFLPHKRAIALGMVAAELMASALRHSHEGGEVTVSYSLTEQDGAYLMTVADTSSKLPLNFTVEMADGLGFRICRSYAVQLGGVLHYSPNLPTGAIFNLAFHT